MVHGKGSLLGRMPGDVGDDWQQFANAARLLRLHVGPPGQEAAVHGPGVRPAARMGITRELDWWLLRAPAHAGVQALVARPQPALPRAARAARRATASPRASAGSSPTTQTQSVLAWMRVGGRATARWRWSAISPRCRAPAIASACPAPAAGGRCSIRTRRSTAGPASAISAPVRRERDARSRPAGLGRASTLPPLATVYLCTDDAARAETWQCRTSRETTADDRTRAWAAGARTPWPIVLAGGRGSRLMELTDIRAKPAVYFGGKSRIIDFALSTPSTPASAASPWPRSTRRTA